VLRRVDIVQTDVSEERRFCTVSTRRNIPEDVFFIVTAVKTSNLTSHVTAMKIRSLLHKNTQDLEHPHLLLDSLLTLLHAISVPGPLKSLKVILIPINVQIFGPCLLFLPCIQWRMSPTIIACTLLTIKNSVGCPHMFFVLR
jgi:hypothetical protein